MDLLFIIILSTVTFLAIILLLTTLLLYAKAKLLPSGKVKLTINEGEKIMEVSPGSSVLATLSNEKIFLPSACGGGGTCGLCRIRVLSGGGTILPTETGFFTRKEQMSNWRLGCQVKIKEDIVLQIPEEILGVRKWECEVVSNANVATFIKEFVVRLPEEESLKFRSGGYIQIDIPPCEVDYSTDIEVATEYCKNWDDMDIWSLKMKNSEHTFRAYSMANHPAEGNIVKLNIRIATPPWSRGKGFAKMNPGVSSSYIFSRKPGDKVTISGPFGEFFIKDTDNEIVFIGGGAGMAPMRSHIFDLFHSKKTARKVSFWYGARSLRETFYQNEFEAIAKEFANFSFHLALSNPLPEDNWTGLTGFIHKVLLDEYLSKQDAPEDIEYYICGPPAMLNACTDMLDNLGVPEENVLYDNFG